MPIPPRIKISEPKYAEKRDILRLDQADVELEDKIQDFNFSTYRQILKTSDELRTIIQTNYTDLNGRVNQNASNISITAQQIRSEVSQSVQTLNGKISANTSAISQTASAIRAEVSSSVQSLDGRISSLSSGVVMKSDFASMYSQAMSDNGVITSSSISTYISSFVDENGVKRLISEATISADKINFKTGSFVIRNLNDQVTFTVDSSGNVTFAGTINGESVFRYPNGDGIRLTDHGLERWNSSANAWVTMYAGRYVKNANSSTVYLSKEDDFVLSLPANSVLYLPTGCSNGKVITVKTISHTVRIKAQGSDKIFTDRAWDSADLNGSDRVEFVYYQSNWYWNYSSI